MKGLRNSHGYSHVRQGDPDLPGWRQARGGRARHRGRGRRVPGAGRAFGLRQVDLAPHARGARGRQRRCDPDR
ncbi:hypothetical protein SCOCK_160087 [Actinacidiphila cocklensis]|uniref:Uncharacterized protein n=1 Tax=Actinacidiphila cocklensis TaxID=887465 RepID=A0A9W4DLR7_9ACTN|nr:hypothetical protein SCOCK_160087 [Actinacidiphila cocklensis]